LAVYIIESVMRGHTNIKSSSLLFGMVPAVYLALCQVCD